MDDEAFSQVLKVEEVVLERCPGTIDTVKAWLQLPAYRQFLECANNSACFQILLLSVVEN